MEHLTSGYKKNLIIEEKTIKNLNYFIYLGYELQEKNCYLNLKENINMKKGNIDIKIRTMEQKHYNKNQKDKLQYHY